MDIRELGKKVSNWGRWGDQDERGTLNFVTPQKLVRAAQLVRKGRAFSLSIPLDQNGPQQGSGVRANPVHLMSAVGADTPRTSQMLGPGAGYTDDFIAMPLQCGTQWDALCHIYYDDALYNGYAANTVTTAGAAKDGIDKLRDGITSRAVLLDIARLQGVDMLEPGYAITSDDLDAAARAQGVAIESGDILLVRTGAMGPWVREKSWSALQGRPLSGLHYSTATWLHQREIAAVATDTPMVEASPSGLEGLLVPLHMVAIRDMGLSLGEYWNLEELASDSAGDGVWESFLVAQPLWITGAVGSPVNPIAFK